MPNTAATLPLLLEPPPPLLDCPPLDWLVELWPVLEGVEPEVLLPDADPLLVDELLLLEVEVSATVTL